MVAKLKTAVPAVQIVGPSSFTHDIGTGGNGSGLARCSTGQGGRSILGSPTCRGAQEIFRLLQITIRQVEPPYTLLENKTIFLLQINGIALEPFVVVRR